MRFKLILSILFLTISTNSYSFEISWNNPSPHGNYFSDTWAHQPNKVYFVGDFNRVWIYSDGNWSNQVLPTNESLNSIWGFSDHDIFAVGTHGFIGHWDGEEWVHQNASSNEHLLDVWGLNGSQIYAVGSCGTLVQYDGTTWVKIVGVTENDLFGIWGLDENHIYAVGFGGTVLVFDGESWNTMSSGTEYVLLDIWGSGPNDLYAVGWDVLLHFDGTEWSEINLGDRTCGGYSVYGFSDSNIYLGSGSYGKIWHWDGNNWNQTNVGTDFTDELMFVWGLDPNHIYVTGLPNCTYLYDGSRWISLREGSRTSFEAIDATDINNQYLAGIYYSITAEYFVGEIYRWDGSNLENIYQSQHEFWLKDFITFQEEIGVSILAVDYSNGLILSGDGEIWNEIDTGFNCNLSSIWGNDPDNYYVSGVGGVVLHWDGSDWTQMATNTSETLHTIWGYSSDDIFTGGNLGGIFHWDGSNWNTMDSGTTNEIYDIWGVDYNCTYAICYASDSSQILHFDGIGWTLILSAPDCMAHKIQGIDQNNIYISATDNNTRRGKMLHWDGQIWTEHLLDSNWSSIKDFEIYDNTIVGAGSNGTFMEVFINLEPTSTPTATPIFTATPTPKSTPTPLPTATVPELGLYLNLSQTSFQPGDRFLLQASISNPGPEDLESKPMAIILDMYSSYFWYPSWSQDFDFNMVNLDIGSEDIELLDIIWPENCGNHSGIFFYGAILTDSLNAIIGNWSQVEFRFSDS